MRTRLIIAFVLLGIGAVLLLIRPGQVGAPAPVVPVPSISATPGLATSTASPTPSPTSLPSPTAVPTPVPLPQLQVFSSMSSLTVTLSLHATVPGGARAAWLWYDTMAGHQPRQFLLDGQNQFQVTTILTPTDELAPFDPLAPFCEPTTDCRLRSLDYWWEIETSAGQRQRVIGQAMLPESAWLAPGRPPIVEERWVEQRTPHFVLRVMPGSDAQRDLAHLVQVAEQGYQRASQVLGVTQPLSITVYMLPRVFWQGGVAYGAGGPLVIAHLDRNYTGIDAWSYLTHEVTHALGDALVPEQGESGGLLGEGYAVYSTSGHYTVEPYEDWAAALVQQNQAPRLCELRYDFYAAQHETAYLLAASYTAYLLREYGDETTRTLYQNQQPQRGNPQQTLEAFCEQNNQQQAVPLNLTNLELERAWRESLKARVIPQAASSAVAARIRQFELLRRYQEQFDPSARILPDDPLTWDVERWQRYSQSARNSNAAVYETMLGAVASVIEAGDFEQAQRLLDGIEAGLTAQQPQPPIIQAYQAITELFASQARALRLGDQQRIAATLAHPALLTRLPLHGDAAIFDLRYDLVALQVAGSTAQAIIEVNGSSADQRSISGLHYAVTLEQQGGHWRISDWQGYAP